MKASPVEQVAEEIRRGEAKRDPNHICRTCEFFQLGDPTPAKPYANRGLCVFMLSREPDFYKHSTQAPFWAERVAFVVTDWEGANCPTWEHRTTIKSKSR